MRVIWPVWNLEGEYQQFPGIMGMASVLAREGVPSEVVPAEHQEVARRLADGRPTILGWSVPTPYARHYLDLNRRLKADFPGVFSVFGGPHPTYFPELIEEQGIDGVCRGEGEEAMRDLVLARIAGRPVRDLPNWWIKDGGEIRRNPLRPLVADLDTLPLPDHSLFRRAQPASVIQAVVVTSRGCPHRCSYCYNHVWRELYQGLGNVIRRRSVGNVMAELAQVREQGYRFIRFMDDLFILDAAWVAEFSARYKDEVGLPFSCLVRANFVTPEIVRQLKAAGCYRMLMGIEAGDDRVRNELLRRNMGREVIIEAARIIRAAGLKLVTANILGIPGGSCAADWETVEINRLCRPHYASAALLQPYPGTWIHEYATREGMVDAGQMERVMSSHGFGLRSDIAFPDPREKRRMENLHKFFPLVSRFPSLRPLVRRLIELPPNRFFDRLYLLAVNWGIHSHEMPLRLGFPVLWRKSPLYRLLRRARGLLRGGRG